MSVPDEQRQARAIRMALGTEDAEVTRAAGGGFNVRISDERAKLALDLYDRLGESSVADTFATGGPVTFGKTVAEAFCAGGRYCPPVIRSEAEFIERYGDTTDARAALVSRDGHAADRERYVTERAECLARAYDAARARVRAAPGRSDVQAFRDLIDRGVLK